MRAKTLKHAFILEAIAMRLYKTQGSSFKIRFVLNIWSIAKFPNNIIAKKLSQLPPIWKFSACSSYV